jgi:predicted PurR-regulated permease PerM
VLTPRPDILRYLGWLGLSLVIGWILVLLGPILVPFAAAAILAYLCDPLVDLMQRWRIPRGVASVLTIVLIAAIVIAFLLLALPLLGRELALIAERFPGYLAYLNERAAPWLKNSLGVDYQFDIASLRQLLAENWRDYQGIATKLVRSLGLGGQALFQAVVNLVLIPVVLFYLLRDWDKLVAVMEQLIPHRWHTTVTDMAREIDRLLAEFLRGQMLVVLVMSVFYSIGLALTGLDFAVPIGIITGVAVVVPFIGITLGVLLGT